MLLQALPYHPALGTLLRRLAGPSCRAVWLRLDEGRKEVFGAFPSKAIVLQRQSLAAESECNFYYMRDWPAFWQALARVLDELPAPPPSPGDASPFRGGLMGFLGYGDAPEDGAGGFPTAWMGMYPCHVHIDHQARTAGFHALPGQEDPHPGWAGLLDAVAMISAETSDAAPLGLPAVAPFRLTRPFAPLTSREQYRRSFQHIQAYLRSGDCYQVNYAQAFRAGCEGSGALAMERLLDTSQAAHAAWLCLPEGEVLSLSPELFLRVRNAEITTRPIKGTAPRHADAGRDAALREELARSPKNRAENLMIVDLLRHDIGQHAATGSVRVDRLFAVESLPLVHHLVSTVSGRLREQSHVVELVRDSFPGGSITGAPKKRAMEIIAELEDTPRSVYCGSIGFFGADGAVELNIAIRTLLRCGDTILAWAGGGIVADSECDAEYEECFHKIGALMRALEDM
jgi:para-aminobenzoate synthetase component 1